MVRSLLLQGLVQEGGHGKLLLDTALYPKSYATNVNEHWLNQLNLVDRTRTASYDFSQSIPACTGTHSIVFSNISRQYATTPSHEICICCDPLLHGSEYVTLCQSAKQLRCCSSGP